MCADLFKNKCTQAAPDHCGEQCQQPCQTLQDIEVGECVCVRKYTGCKKMRHRLLALGLTPHTRVNIVQKAPLGDPILLQIGDSNLTLSLSEASQVEVEPVG